MAKDVLDQVPAGYKRGNKGWIVPTQTGNSQKIRDLQTQNADLLDRIAALEDAMSNLPNKKAKKGN